MIIPYPGDYRPTEPCPWLAHIAECANAAADAIEDTEFHMARLDMVGGGDAVERIDALQTEVASHVAQMEAATRGLASKAWTHRTVSGRATPPPKPITSARQVATLREIAVAARGVADLLDGWVPLEPPGVRMGMTKAALADIAKLVRIIVAQHAGLLGSVPGYPTPRLSRAWRNDLGVKLPGVTRSPRSKLGIKAAPLRIRGGRLRSAFPAAPSI